MSTAISISNLSKSYRIGLLQKRNDTLRDALISVLKLPGRLFSREGSDYEIMWALKDVSFEVSKGESVGIIGRNGAGKSTILKILSRITSPTSGSATINGRVGSLLEVGTGFHPELTGRENIFLNGAILGMKNREIRRKMDEIIAFSEIEKFLDTPIKRYSSGMYVRLAFAVAAHLEPEILVVDEVLAVGDVIFQRKCLGKMKDISSEGRTVLFVSHNMLALRDICKRSILLDSGRLVCDADTGVAIDRYMGESSGLTSRVEWKGDDVPRNSFFRLLSFDIVDEAGNSVSQMKMSGDLFFKIAFETLADNVRARFSITLFDSNGMCLFSSMNAREEYMKVETNHKGCYTSGCRLYGNLLNAGRFIITLTCWANNWDGFFRVHNFSTFEMVDDGVLRGDYYGQKGGPFSPDLEWKTTADNI